MKFIKCKKNIFELIVVKASLHDSHRQLGTRTS